MQSVYWFCFVIGGVFVAIATLGGAGEVEFDTDADFDIDADLDADADIDVDLDADADIDADADLDADADYEIDTDVALERRPNATVRRGLGLGILTSFKFWTVGGCFFGLTGLVLTAAQPTLGPVLILVISLLMGLTIGGMLAGALRLLKRRHVDSLVRSKDFAGLVGTVELPFDATSKGKVSLQLGSNTLHLIALTDDKTAFVPGDKVLVVNEENNRLWVVAAEGSAPSRPPRQSG
ncbi:MAG: hypothetical protein AAFU71_12715 [Cyanobacteria bacterium J06632_22]